MGNKHVQCVVAMPLYCSNVLWQVALMVEECGGLDKVEALQSHENEASSLFLLRVYDEKHRILTFYKFFISL